MTEREAELLERLTRLEEQSKLHISRHDSNLTLISELKTELQDVKKRVNYYDRIALRYGGIIIGIMAFGAYIASRSDAAKNSVIELFKASQ